MRIISIIHDGLLNADNILIEMTVREYLNIGERILKNNPYQRKRVSRSSTVYSLLNTDLQKLCTIPTITLAFSEGCGNVALTEGMESGELEQTLNNSLIILDGLQRTYTMIDVDRDLTFVGEEREAFYNHMLRIELYKGLSKTGILYRMLTLNTGQTPMSKRHEIEILYSSFLERPIDGIRFIRLASPEHCEGIDDYDFDDAIEGFNSFIDSDESAIDHMKLLSVIQRLDKLTNDNFQRDLFEQYIRLYNSFVHKFDLLSDHWSVADIKELGLSSVYGHNIPSFFNKSQTMSAFGAAIGEVLWGNKERGLGNIENVVTDFYFEGNPSYAMSQFLKELDIVRMTAKKIGVAQRMFLKFFFLSLFSPNTEHFRNIERSIQNAVTNYSYESRI